MLSYHICEVRDTHTTVTVCCCVRCGPLDPCRERGVCAPLETPAEGEAYVAPLETPAEGEAYVAPLETPAEGEAYVPPLETPAEGEAYVYPPPPPPTHTPLSLFVAGSGIASWWPRCSTVQWSEGVVYRALSLRQ